MNVFRIKFFRWEVFIALALNLLLFGAMILFRFDQPERRNPPVEITLDVSDFAPPQPKEMVLPEQPTSGGAAKSAAIETLAEARSATEMAREAMKEFTPKAEAAVAVLQPISSERKYELTRIEHGIKTFDAIGSVRAGLPTGELPAGHRIGASFGQRGDAKRRATGVRRYGGSELTEKAVGKALAYLAGKQNSNGSWGSAECFKTGDAAALSALALLAFFAHGENFQSGKYAEHIRKGCDFLVELANTPNIEYAGNGFGHAILTYALAEGYAVSGSMSLRAALEERLKFIVARQNKFGSFALNYDNSPQAPPPVEQLDNPLLKEIVVGEPACDLSLLGWHIQAMVAANNSGVAVDGLDRALMLAAEALIKIHQADKGGFSQGINMKRFAASDNMNPVGLLGLQLLNAGNSSPARRTERLLREVALPKWRHSGKFPLYRWYYQTQSVFQEEKGRGKRWRSWNDNLKSELLKARQSDGGWPMPGGDNSFKVKNKTDLTIYSTSLCALMLQVYYRYLPGYSIAEGEGLSTLADDYDLGGAGFISRLPGGANPLAAVILGIGNNDMEPIHFGRFDGIPTDNCAPLAEGEFIIHAGMKSTIPVRKTEDWPQTLQPNQRIAVFLDELLPRNFKGHLRLLLGVVGTEAEANRHSMSFEAVLNGKRLYNAILPCSKQLVEVVVPRDTMQPFGNILQIRNNGKATLAFDAAELSAINKVGEKLFLCADAKELKQLPPDIHALFSASAPPEDTVVCELPGYSENRQLLPEITAYEKGKTYIGKYPAPGSEHMGNGFQLHYLRQAGREIVDWLGGGGSGVKITGILTGGKFYDTIFQTAYPALSALRQTARLFEGNPHRLSSTLYPKHGEKPLLFGNVAAAYNAPGIATIVVARRFPVPEEAELAAIIPWSGQTEVFIENGFLPENSPFAGLAAKLETETQSMVIENNLFRYAAVFPELTVIRLVRRGARKMRAKFFADRGVPGRQQIVFDHYAISYVLPQAADDLKKMPLRRSDSFAASYGHNASFSRIPATQVTEGFHKFVPEEKKSIVITHRVNADADDRFDSVYLMLESVPAGACYLSFDVYARATGLKSHERMNGAALRFALGNRLYATHVPLDRWRQVVLPLDDINLLSWRSLRFLAPDGILSRNIKSVSYEINNLAVWCK